MRAMMDRWERRDWLHRDRRRCDHQDRAALRAVDAPLEVTGQPADLGSFERARVALARARARERAAAAI